MGAFFGSINADLIAALAAANGQQAAGQRHDEADRPAKAGVIGRRGRLVQHALAQLIGPDLENRALRGDGQQLAALGGSHRFGRQRRGELGFPERSVAPSVPLAVLGLHRLGTHRAHRAFPPSAGP